MEELDDLARQFSVSRYVILRRLLTVGHTTPAHYCTISAKLDEEQQQARDKSRGKSAGRPATFRHGRAQPRSPLRPTGA
jgi:Zn-dependent peptidase ImmA (M78 family)